MELKNALIELNTSEIKFSNFEEIKEQVAEIMSEYKGVVFADKDIKDAKAVIADLRKKKTAIEEKRKAIKKEWNVPLAEFEGKVKEITVLIDAPIEEIDKQVKEYEELKKVEKRAEIETYFEKMCTEVIDYLKLESIFDNRWLNATTSIKKVFDEIDNYILTTKNNVETIKAFNSDAEEKALEAYKRTMQLSDAINLINTHEQIKRDTLEAERKKREAEAQQKLIEAEQEKQKAIDEALKAEREAKQSEEKKEKPEELQGFQVEAEVEGFDVTTGFDVEERNEILYYIKGNDEELANVEMYLNSIGLEFERISK